MFCMLKEKYPAYVSKHNSNRQKYFYVIMPSKDTKILEFNQY